LRARLKHDILPNVGRINEPTSESSIVKAQRECADIAEG